MKTPENRFVYKKGDLSCDGISLASLAREFGTPLYVYSARSFVEKIQAYQKGLSGLDSLICFAMKSNSNLSILKLVRSERAGVDVVSGGELFRAHQAGIPATKVVFSGVGKTRKEIKEGLLYQGKGIFSFHVESLAELQTINQVASEMGVRARVGLRFNPDVDPKTHPYISTGIKKNKFGVNQDEIQAALDLLKKLAFIQLKGISIHIGSQLLSLDPIEDAFRKLLELLDEAKPSIEYLDLGGGLGIQYEDEMPPTIEAYCRLIQKYFGKSSRVRGKYRILLEPGRQISGNAGVLLTEVLYRKIRKLQDFLIVDAGMTELIRPALYGSFHQILPLEESKSKGSLKKTTVVGPICESSDFLAKGRPLSQSLNSGDFLAVLSAGAYGFTMASQYNSRPRPAEVLIENGKARLIRKRENYEHLLMGETDPTINCESL